MPDVVTVSQEVSLSDPKLKALATRVLNGFKLAALKATAHTADAHSYPLGPVGSAEHVFHDRFVTLSRDRQTGARARTRTLLAASPAVRANTVGADLTGLDLHANRSVLDAVSALPVPAALRLTRADLDTRRTLHGPGGLMPLQPSTKLALRIHKVRCDDETNPEWGGDDEIALGGSTVDETGDVKKVAEFMVGDSFDDGESKTYNPPRTFTTFNLTEGNAWPKSYIVPLVLAEKDMGGLAGFLDQLLAKVKEKVIEALTGAISEPLGPLEGPLGEILIVVVTWVVSKIFEWLSAWWSDDVFAPVVASVSIPSAEATFSNGSKDGPQNTAVFKGFGGRYTVTYDWLLS